MFLYSPNPLLTTYQRRTARKHNVAIPLGTHENLRAGGNIVVPLSIEID